MAESADPVRSRRSLLAASLGGLAALVGILTIGAGKASINKSVAGLTSGSLVFAVVRTGDGNAWVRKVKPNSGSFTVYMNKVSSSATTVSWIAFG